jgi:dTDP-4-dehydrorhamnose reductase
MKIIIIGAQGMLGQELAKTFSGDKPLLWDKQDIDISNELSVIEKIDQVKPDIIINVAAYNDVDGAEKSWPLAEQINGFGPGYLAKALHSSGGILVHYSTDYVFKGNRKEGYLENDQPDPQSAYAKSKLMGELEVQKNINRFYIIRLSRLFGRPAASAAGKKSFVQLMLDLSKTKHEIDVVNEELDSPTYAPDLARQTKQIIEQNMPFGIYHVTNSGSCTWFDFAREIFTLKKISVKLHPVPTSFFPRPAVRPRYSVLQNTKLPALRSWQSALREFLSHNTD